MKRLIIAGLLTTFLLTGCTNPAVASQTLLDAGYKDLDYQGYSVLGCGKGDTVADKFEVTAPSGNRITVVVCSGVFKGATIRHL